MWPYKPLFAVYLATMALDPVGYGGIDERYNVWN